MGVYLFRNFLGCRIRFLAATRFKNEFRKPNSFAYASKSNNTDTKARPSSLSYKYVGYVQEGST
jgi:hypothetical protein